MLIAVDHHNGVPVYRQLMDQFQFKKYNHYFTTIQAVIVLRIGEPN